MPKPFGMSNLPYGDIASFMSQLSELATKLSADATERQRVEAAREVLITEIENKYGTYRLIFGHIFAERRAVIDACFQVIDEGRARGDRGMVLSAMMDLGKLVQTSPLPDFEKVRSMLEGADVFEI